MIESVSSASSQKELLNVLNGRAVSRRPLWFMRQAGRYLKEYKQVREQAGSFLKLCYTPELAAEVTIQPLRRFDLDAAILFSDILVIPQALGSTLDFVENEGPVLQTVRSKDDVSKLDDNRIAEILGPIIETVKLVKPQLKPHESFIGFCGAPWTVATYMIEGGTSSDRALAKKAAFSGEAWFDQLIDILVETSIEYLAMQVAGGVEVLQIFDSWASDLPDIFRGKYCFKPISRIISGLRDKGITVPIIGFARGLGSGQEEFVDRVDVSAVGVESNLSLAWIRDNLIGKTVVQGNLDPVLLDCGGPGLAINIEHILQHLPKDRHIFNLGHGIRQTTDVEHVSQMIDIVREYDNKSG